MNSKQGYFIINSTNTENEQQQQQEKQLSHSKDRGYYVTRGQKYMYQTVLVFSHFIDCCNHF